MAQSSASYGGAKFAPEDGKKLLIIGQDLGSVGGLSNYSNGYIDHFEQYPAGVTTYTSLPSLNGLSTRDNWGAGDVHAELYRTDENFDNSAIAIGLYLVGQLGNIVGGGFDGPIKNLGNWIKQQERPVFLRIGYEFDYPDNNYDAGQFKAAWKRIVHVFDEIEVSNVAYVWQSDGSNTTNIINWYPGDEYVNWLGYSNFDEPNPGQNMRDFAEEHDKPIMIAEATPRQNLDDGNGEQYWTNWFEPMFNTIYDDDHIKALAYINADWESQSLWDGEGWGDSRVQIDETIEANWRAEIAKDAWMLASETLFEELEYDRWTEWIVREPVTSVEAEMKNEGNMMIYYNGEGVKIDTNLPVQDAVIYSLQGQIIDTNYDQNSQLIECSRKTPTNVSVVKVILTSGQVVTKKIFIN